MGKILRNYQGGGETTGQHFCEVTTSDVRAVLRHAPADLRGGTLQQHSRVLVATVAYQENPHLCLQIRAARFQVFRGA